MQSNRNRENSRSSSEDKNKKREKQARQSLTQRPSIPRSLHAEQKQEKTPTSCCTKLNCFFFKPQNILKVLKLCYWFLLSESLIPFVLGILGLGVDGSEIQTIYKSIVSIQYYNKYENCKDWHGKVPKIQRIVFPIYLALSVIQAIICSCIQIKQMITIIILLMFAAAYIILAIYGKRQFDKIYLNRYDTSTCQEYFDEIFNSSLQSDFNLAKQNLCMQSQKCICRIDNPSSFNQTVISKLYYTSQGSGVQNALACPNINSYSFSSKGPQILENLELKYNCSGLCAPESIYYFSNINRGTPTESDSCFSVILNQLESTRRIIYIPILIIAAFMILTLIIIFFTIRQYEKDPACIILRMVSLHVQMTNHQSQIQHQQSILNSNVNNSNIVNSQSVVHVIGEQHFQDGDQSEIHNNSSIQQNNLYNPGFQNHKVTQSILLNSNQNENNSHISPSNMNNSSAQKKVTILSPQTQRNVTGIKCDSVVQQK